MPTGAAPVKPLLLPAVPHLPQHASWLQPLPLLEWSPCPLYVVSSSLVAACQPANPLPREACLHPWLVGSLIGRQRRWALLSSAAGLPAVASGHRSDFQDPAEIAPELGPAPAPAQVEALRARPLVKLQQIGLVLTREAVF